MAMRRSYNVFSLVDVPRFTIGLSPPEGAKLAFGVPAEVPSLSGFVYSFARRLCLNNINVKAIRETNKKGSLKL